MRCRRCAEAPATLRHVLQAAPRLRRPRDRYACRPRWFPRVPEGRGPSDASLVLRSLQSVDQSPYLDTLVRLLQCYVPTLCPLPSALSFFFFFPPSPPHLPFPNPPPSSFSPRRSAGGRGTRTFGGPI